MIFILHLSIITLFYYSLVIIDVYNKAKNIPRQFKYGWLWAMLIPIFGPIVYLLGPNYNNKEADGKRVFFLIILCALSIDLLTTPLRAISFMLCAIVTFVLFFVFICIVLKQYSTRLKPEYILVATIIGSVLLEMPLRIISFASSMVSLPDSIFHVLGIILGYMYYKTTKTFKVIILSISVVSCVFLYFKGYDMWVHKLGYGTFTGKINDNSRVYDFNFQTNIGDTLSLSDFRGKYLLLDCWFTYCGICYREMPEVQKTYDEYKDNPNVKVFSMHSTIQEKNRNKSPENYATGTEILKREGFDYPCLSIDIKDSILTELGVEGYPTVLIFDRESKLVFRGSIGNAANYLEKIIPN